MISLIDYSMVEQARFIRNVLECVVVEHLCRTIAPGEIEALLKTIDIHAYVLKHDDSDALCELDNAFHQMLFDLSKKQQAYDIIRWMSIHFDRVRSLSLRAVKEIKIVEDHRTIVDAIARNDAGEARKNHGQAFEPLPDRRTGAQTAPSRFFSAFGDAGKKQKRRNWSCEYEDDTALVWRRV